MAKKRIRREKLPPKDLESKAAEARGQLVEAYFYMQNRDRSAEMQRNFRIVEQKVDRTWNAYQNSFESRLNNAVLDNETNRLVSPRKKNRGKLKR